MTCVDDAEDCIICLDNSQNQRLLNCDHHFCGRCLNQIKDISGRHTHILCPLCRQLTTLSWQNTIESLPIIWCASERRGSRKYLLRNYYCCVHPEFHSNSYCLDCQASYCLICTFVNGHDKSHSLEPLERTQSGLTHVMSRGALCAFIKTNSIVVVISVLVLVVMATVLYGGWSLLLEIMCEIRSGCLYILTSIWFCVKYLFIQAEIDDELMLLLYG